MGRWLQWDDDRNMEKHLLQKGKRRHVVQLAAHCSDFFSENPSGDGLTLIAFQIDGTWPGRTSYTLITRSVYSESHCANDLHAIMQSLINFLLLMVMIPWNSLRGRMTFVGQRIPLENSDRSVDCLLGDSKMTLSFNNLHLFLKA